MKKLYIIFSALFISVSASAGEMANVTYAINFLTTKTGVALTNKEATPTKAINMVWLMSVVDLMNKKATASSKQTSYGTGEFATMQACDVDAVDYAARNLFNCFAAGYGKIDGYKCGLCPESYYCPADMNNGISCDTVEPNTTTNGTGAKTPEECGLFSFVINSGSDRLFALQLADWAALTGAVVNYKVDWGDGTPITDFITDPSSITHTYPAANTDYTVRVSGQLYGNFTSSSATQAVNLLTLHNTAEDDAPTPCDGCGKLKSILTDYTYLFPLARNITFVTSANGRNYFMAYAFYGNRNLTSMPSDFLSKVTTIGTYFLYNTFSKTGFTQLPDGFLSWITTASTGFLNNTFQNTPLERLPDDFLSNLIKIPENSFNYTFANTNLTELPQNFLSNMAGSVNTGGFTYFLSGCTQLKRLPDFFLKNVTGMSLSGSGLNSFCNGCTALESTGDNFLARNNGWKGGGSMLANTPKLSFASFGSWLINGPNRQQNGDSGVLSATSGSAANPMDIWLWWMTIPVWYNVPPLGPVNAAISKIHVPAHLVDSWKASTLITKVSGGSAAAKVFPILCSEIKPSQIAEFGPYPAGYCCTNNDAVDTDTCIPNT